mgnify:FL=1
MNLQIIQNKIYEIRGQRVMLDFDLAELYGVETKNLNLSVKRNIKRFPPDFMFQLTNSEWESLRFQFVTSKRGGRRYMPYDKISQLQSKLMELKSYIEDVFTDYNDINEDTRIQLELINQTLAALQADKKLTDKPRKRIGYWTGDER